MVKPADAICFGGGRRGGKTDAMKPFEESDPVGEYQPIAVTIHGNPGPMTRRALEAMACAAVDQFNDRGTIPPDVGLAKLVNERKPD